jgi:hypothetical protein
MNSSQNINDVLSLQMVLFVQACDKIIDGIDYYDLYIALEISFPMEI